MKKIFIPLMTVTVVAALLLGGCMPGAAPPVTPPPVTPPPVTPPPVTPPPVTPPPEEVEPIKIGLVLPYSGMFGGSAYEGDYGATLAVEDINAAGGLLGRPVELRKYDVVNWETEKLVAAREYLLAEGVDAFETLFGVSGLIELYSVPDVGGRPCLQYHTTEPFAEMIADDLDRYWNQVSYDDTGRNYGPNAYVGYTKIIPEEFGYDYEEYASKTVAILTSDLTYSLDISARFRALIADDPEWEEVYYSEFPFGGTEFGAQLAEIRALEPEPGLIMFFEVSTAGSAAFVMQFLPDPTNSIVHIQWGMSDSAYHEEVGQAGEGICGQGQPVSNPTKEFADFEKRFWDRFGWLCVGTGASVYDRWMGWAEAVETVGDVTDYQAIVDELIRMHYKGYTFGPDGWNVCPADHNDRVGLNPRMGQYVEWIDPACDLGPTYGNNLHLFQAKWTTDWGSYPIPLLIQGYLTEDYMQTYYGYSAVGTHVEERGMAFEVPPYFD